MKFGLKLTLSAAALALTMGLAHAEDILKVGTEGAYPPFNNLTADASLRNNESMK